MAKTGETRKTNQPLKIDRLPPVVHEAILYLRNIQGKTWEEIEAQSAEKYSATWQAGAGGFVDWDNLPIAVLELFPGMKLGHSLLQRWWDLRVEQVQANVRRLSVQAREIAEVFAKATKKGDKDAVQSAARDILLGILAEDGTVGARAGVAGGLIKLGKLIQTDRLNELRERKVAVDERRVAQLEKDAEAKRRKMDEETQSTVKKLNKGELTIDDLNKLRRNTFGLPPLGADGKEVAA